MATKIITKGCQNLPWEERPANSKSPLWRYSQNPILGWNPIPNAARVYNSAIVPFQGAFAGVFRADAKNGRACLHSGFSKDGIDIELSPDPIQWVDEDGKAFQPNYAYDPRVVQIDDWYYINWCVDFHGAAIGMGKTKDFKTFIRIPNPTIPFNRNGVLFPRKINGKCQLLTRPSDSGHTPFGDIFISESPDLIHWGNHHYVMGAGGTGWWEGTKIGAGPIPIETSEGWLLIYHGVSGTCNGFVYSMGVAVLDLEEPWKVKYRARDYILTPEMPYETTGFVPNVAFPCAALHDENSGNIAIYYGAADTYTAVAFGNIYELLDFAKTRN